MIMIIIIIIITITIIIMMIKNLYTDNGAKYQNPIYKVNFYKRKSKTFQNTIRFLLAEDS